MRDLVVLLCASVTLAPSPARAETPARLFADDASGMVKIKVRCPGGPQQGTGFLLGARLVMTARHVVVDDKGRSCTAEVVQEGTRKTVKVVRWAGVRVAKAKASTDLALAVLASPLSGFNFSISHSSPRPGQLVMAFGYAYGQPLSLNQGHVAMRMTQQRVPLLSIRVLEAPGASGGPILNASGEVVGVNQYGGGGLLLAVDLAHLVHSRPAELCLGVAVGQAATICDAGKHATGVLTQDKPPQLCHGIAIAAPFQTCPTFPTIPGESPAVVFVQSQCPSVGAWTGSGFLLGPRLMMTARHVLVDSETGEGCKTTVSQGLFGHAVRVRQWVGIQRSDSQVPTDLAFAVLESPLKGHYFSLSPTSPGPGETVHALDYLAGESSTTNRGKVVRFISSYGIRQLELRVTVASGRAGGPIVNAKNQVVGIAQTWDSDTNAVYSVDLANLMNGDPHQLCIGLANGSGATICAGSAASTPTLFSEDTSPEVCGNRAANSPFTYCLNTSDRPRTTPISTDVNTPLAFTGCWATTADSFDESQKTSAVAAGTPRLYFVYRLNQIQVGTWVSLTLTGPNGTRDLRASEPLVISNPASTYWRDGPLALSGSPLTPGRWTLTANVTKGSSAGATCSYAFNVA